VRERRAARRLSKELDRLLAGEPVRRAPAAAVPPQYVGHPAEDEIEAARYLARLSARLPPVPADLEKRVRAIVRSPAVCRPVAWRSAAWGALTALLILVAFWFLMPGGQKAWAQMLRALQLGQTRIELTPALDGGESRAVRETLRDLVEVELLIGRAPALPKTLPEGYVIQEIAAVSFPDLPSWISQPLYVELCYGREGEPSDLRLRQYRLLFKQFGGISGVQFSGDTVIGLEEVDVGGVRGTMLTFAPEGSATGLSPADAKHRTVLWERDGLLIELEASELPADELLLVARSVR
jgi:hypothetical protein